MVYSCGGLQSDVHFMKEIWEVSCCLAVGHERRCVSRGWSLENLSNIEWLVQGSKTTSLLQMPVKLFFQSFQQEGKVPH